MLIVTGVSAGTAYSPNRHGMVTRRPMIGITGRERMLSDPQLLDAREIGRQLGSRAAKHQSLPPGPAPVLRYRVRLQQGAVAFADDSAGQTKEMFLAQRFARTVAIQVCGLPR